MDAVAHVLDGYLKPDSPRPVAVALSGGGDSVALLLLADRWAKAHGRQILVLSVDHRLQAQGAEWVAECARLAARLGAEFHALAWEGAKPSTGLPAAARAARHALLAGAAREAGARVLLLGHTADDVLEARAMRDAGSTTPDPKIWSPSPAWPEGRGMFLLRPLLGVRRAVLRAWLSGQGERWIEDPANEDARFARARARALAHSGVVERIDDLPLGAFESAQCDGFGAVTFERAAFREADPAAASRWIGLAAVCAGGGARLPSSAARDRLAERLSSAEHFRATLAGARIAADAEQIRLAREAGEARRGGLPSVTLGGALVWDGRFEIAPLAEGLEVRPLGGMARRLPPDQRRALAALPAEVRPALPAVVDASGAVTSPLLGASPAKAECLVGDRLRAAAGMVTREPN